jgi:hypothetical protein
MTECTCTTVIDGEVWHGLTCPMREHTKLARAGLRAIRMGARDEGFEAENNDCFVKAVQAVTGVPYRDAHAFVSRRFARKNGHSTPEVPERMRDIATKAETIYGFRVFAKPAATGQRVRRTRFGYRTVASYRTLQSFTRTHRTGRWLLWSNSHALAVIDGVVYDNGAAGPKTHVTGVYEFIESSKVESQEATCKA